VLGSQSGDSDPQLGITKAGNRYLRQLLVECATMSSDLMERTRPYDSGVSDWAHAAAATREDEPS
jgi:transposase